jgi:hypothetical protein
METVELKLAEWRKLYGELSEAQLSLREARARRPAGNAVTAELEARVKRLQEESNGALDAVHAALGGRKPRDPAPN